MIILKGASGPVDTLQFAPDGCRLVAPAERGVQVWDEVTRGGRPTSLLDVPRVNGVEFAPDGSLLLYPPLILRDLERGSSIEIPVEVQSAWYIWGSLTPDGRSVVVAQYERAYAPARFFRRSLDEPVCSVWSLSFPGQILSRPLFLSAERFATFEVWLEQEPNLPLRAGPAYVTRDAATGAVTSEVRGEGDVGDTYGWPVLSADRRLIAARRHGWIAVFQADDFNISPVIIRNDNRKEFTGLAFHPSGRFLAATSNDATVKFYDTTTWKLAHAFDWDVGRLRSIAFSPDGMLAAGGGDKGKIVVWDVDL